MLLAAALLSGCLLAVGGLLPRWLAQSTWPARAPGPALLLWQATGLAGGLLVPALCLDAALAPYAGTPLAALAALDRPPGWPSLLAAGVGLAVLSRLVGVLVTSTVQVTRDRRRNRVMVDLVGDRNPLLRGASVLDHDVPVAYCLPGLRPRLVLSRGTLALLSLDELRAVLAHEQAHLEQRHDLVVLPFAALAATLPRFPPVLTARREVGLLVELLADDRAAQAHDGACLAAALWKIGTGQAPAGAFGIAGQDVLLRARRLLEPPAPLTAAARYAVVALAAVVALSPVLALGLPSLG